MNPITDALNRIAEEYQNKINPDSRFYVLVDLGKVLEILGATDDVSDYERVMAVVPLKRLPEGGMPFEVDGADLQKHVQLESGIAVAKWVAESSGLESKPYSPSATMICIYT